VAKKLKICHVITRMIVGGAQENTLLTTRSHIEKGHRVTLVTGPSPGPEGELLARECVGGLEIGELPPLVRAIRPIKDVAACRQLTRFFREGSFDVVHTHSSKAGVLGRIAARKARIPFIVHTVHGQAFHPYQSSWKNALYIWAERIAARYCDRIFAVAEAMVEQCVAAGVAPRSMYKVVYSGMDMDAFLTSRRCPKLRAELGIAEDALVVGKIARLFELKGHHFLIAAASAIVAEMPTVRFLLVGDGNLYEQLQDDIRARGLAEHFVFTGLVPPADVPQYTAQMDVLAHLSLREGLPRTVVQALATGIPAVGFSLDGTPEVIVEGETGHICPPENVQAVTEALLDLLRNGEKRRRMGAAGRERVKEQFCWRRMGDVLEAEYLRGLA